ncbi:MAG: TIGR03915 family putative DNA repair protein [Deltaproteobacteria bacterium]|jgi:probable DNA metabolism protein|nr:TIGR03915 family putative DNA repair protein [Deltaproteobacteria bacterium]
MLAFVHDGGFEGLLSAVFDAYSLKRFPDLLLSGKDTPPLTVTAAHTVATSREKAERVFAGLKKRLSREGSHDILLAFLSEEPGIATLLFRHIQAVFDRPAFPEGDFADATTFKIDRIARQVSRERHQLLGFARFQKTAEGLYFAVLRPKYNVLALMLPHFEARFAAQRWILYDAGRGFGFLHDQSGIRELWLDRGTLHGAQLPESLLAPDEPFFQELWRGYFDATAIKERANPELQARCLPRRYWAYITELRPCLRP